MVGKFPILSRVIGFLFIPIFAVLAVLLNGFYGSTPDYNAEILVEGIGQQVTVDRDKYGVPFIKGRSDRDVFFAMGYVQAQDRLWQMESQRRLVQGRLSEILGPQALNRDIWMRTLGLHIAAQEAWHHLGKDSQDALRAYSDGVNTWISQNDQLPPEFRVFNYKPEPWKPADSLAMGKLFALSLGANYNRELQRQLGRKILSPKHFKSFYSWSDDLHQLSVPESDDLTNILNLNLELERSEFIGGKNVGSNAWVISGDLTKSGKAILANDPHLALQIPSLWYAAKLQGNDINVSGLTLVGFPVIIFGQNEQIAWGGTNLLADTQDLISERINPENPSLYWHENKWMPFSEREEVIHVSAGFPEALRRKIKPITLRVRSTKSGPVISDVVDDVGQTLSLRWTALDPIDTTFESILNLNYAKDWESFQDALRLYVVPTLNLLYADKHNNIGYSAVGRVPVREKGEGMLPAGPDNSGWLSHIAWDNMPKVLNPKNGFIVNANNKSVDDNYPYFISNDWADPARARRISELLQEKINAGSLIDVAYVATMQNDVVDLNAIELVKAIKLVLDQEKSKEIEVSHKELLAELYSWDGNMHANSYAPALYVSLVRHLKMELYTDEFSHYSARNSSVNATSSIIDSVDTTVVKRTLEIDRFWCDDIDTDNLESCKFVIQKSIDDAVAELSKLTGESFNSWRWQSINKRIYQHNPFSRVDVVSDLFEREAGGDGTSDTVNVAGYHFDESEGYTQTFGAGFRQIFEMTPDTSQYLVNSTGQSGNIFSRYYDDMIVLMQNNTPYLLSPSAEAGRTVLLPNNSEKK